MRIAWLELRNSLSDILIENATDRAAAKGVRLDRAQLETAVKARAAELVDQVLSEFVSASGECWCCTCAQGHSA